MVLYNKLILWSRKSFYNRCKNSIHPDYNHQIEWVIKPKNGAKYFTREELSKCPGVF